MGGNGLVADSRSSRNHRKSQNVGYQLALASSGKYWPIFKQDWVSKNKPFHRRKTQGLGEQTCGCQGGAGGSGMDWESGVNKYELLHLEWISNEILLYSTGNSI